MSEPTLSDVLEHLKRLEAKVDRETVPEKPWSEMTREEKVAFTDRKYGGPSAFDPRKASDDQKLAFIEQNGLDAYRSALRRTAGE